MFSKLIREFLKRQKAQRLKKRLAKQEKKLRALETTIKNKLDSYHPPKQ